MNNEELKKVEVKGKLDDMKTNLKKAAICQGLATAMVIGVPTILPYLNYDADILRTWGLCMAPIVVIGGGRIVYKLKEYFSMKKDYENNQDTYETEEKGMGMR